MIIKMPKPTKAEMIRTFFNQWDPLDFVKEAGYMFYNYEAEDLAQQIRKNSKPEKIASIIQQLMEEKAEIEKFDKRIDPEECMQIAMYISSWMKSQ